MKKNSWVIGGGSVALAILYYFWLADGWWKAGFGLINGLFLVLIGVIYWEETKNNKYWWGMWGGSLVLGAFLGIRSNEFVSLLNVLTVVIINSLLAGLASNNRAILGFKVILGTWFGLLGNLGKELWGIVSKLKEISPKKMDNWQKVVAGIIISLPLLFVFGGLFLAADPIFAKLVGQIKLPELELGKILSFKNLTTVGFLGAVLAALKQKLAKSDGVFKPWKNVSEIFIATLILQGLFLIFALVQIRYFGVNAETLRQMGITFSDYTRQGYSQMIISCLLAWGIVYGLNFVMRSQLETGSGHHQNTKYLSYAFMGEILLFVVTATKRNWLYQSVYGFTEIRLLGFWLSLWLVAIVAITFVKFWQNRDVDFLVRRMLITSMVILIGLNIFNIDRVIVVTRPAKLAQGVDYEYMVGLSNDAWMGFEELLADVERRIDNNEISSQEEAARLSSMVKRLGYKKTSLERQSKDNWRWGGNFNWADRMAWEYLSKNSERMDRIYNRLSAEKDRLLEARKKSLKERADRYKNEIRKILQNAKFVNINDFPLEDYYFGSQELMRTDISVTIKQEVVNDVKQQIWNVTDRNCTLLEGGQWATNTNPFNSYLIRCSL